MNFYICLTLSHRCFADERDRMKQSTTKLCIILLIVTVVLFSGAFAFVGAQVSVISDAENQTTQAYLAIVAADKAGGDVDGLIVQLNSAINLTAQAKELVISNPAQASDLADQARLIALNVTQNASVVEQSALSSFPVVEVGVAVGALVLGVVVYFVGPRVFWRAWFRFRRNYLVAVKKVEGEAKSLVVTAEQVCAVILGVTVLVAFVSVSGFLLPVGQGERFSELGILGPNQMLGDYPSEVVAGEVVSLFGYVGNHMGEPVFYTVMVKLGDNETVVNPASIAAMQQYSQVVANNQSWTFPIDVTLSTVGVNQRLIFELWSYNQTVGQVYYQEIWGQVKLNVTAPAR